MKLQKIEIENYRSIKKLEFVFEPRCRVLVGINESGKSNILHALSHLDPDVKVSAHDLREAGRDEDGSLKGRIWFRFQLEDLECEQVTSELAKLMFGIDVKLDKIAKFNGQDYTVSEFVRLKRNVLWRVEINTELKSATHFELEGGWQFKAKIGVPISTTKTSLTLADDTVVPLKSFSLVNYDEGSGVPNDQVLPARVQSLNDAFGKVIRDFVKQALPPVIFWEYSERNLLPARIDINEFVADPDSCAPLKHMFALGGYADPSDAIQNAQKLGRMRNLLEKISGFTTKHMKNVWRDLKNVEVELAQNGDVIESFVRDSENVYQFARRSDGFKRFFTFLLMVSAKVKANVLEGAVYLHDEPEIGLHPTGAQYLRDELIKIAKSNFVVYSTHSIFMIDRENIGRHLIVKKDNEITSVTPVNQANIVDEEVIYNALGWSVFESLKETNLVFEGWRDHRLFKAAISRLPASHKTHLALVQSFGACFAKGCKDVRNVTPLLELANRRCFIVSDSDCVAKQNQRDYEGWGTWFCYDDLDSASPLTAEDYVKPTALLHAIRAVADRHEVDTKNLPELSTVTSDRIGVVRNWFRQHHKTDKNGLDALMHEFKSAVFNEIKPAQVEPSYYDMLSKLVEECNKSA